MFVYNFLILIYGLVIRNASLRKTKAKQWVRGRKHWRAQLTEKIKSLGDKHRVWVHCASYGEFEQGRPLIESIRIKYPDKKIILSFFSPSGYEAFKSWPGADLICYLPLDTPSNARDFVSIVQPSTVIFIKYEFWVNLLSELKKRNIPTYLVSANFKSHNPFFKWYGGIFRRSLSTFNRLFIQDKNSAALLESIGIKNYTVGGDTRFDRVLQIRNTHEEISRVRDFKGSSALIIAGSTWPKDEDLVLGAFSRIKNTGAKLILVPHDIEPKLLKNTMDKLNALKLQYSLYTEEINPASQVLVLNTMGLLSKIYRYGDCAYIGGGFNGGLHNSLEAAVYGIPVTFYGEEYVNYNEVVDLVEMSAAVKVKNEEDLSQAFKTFIGNADQKKLISEKLQNYFSENSNVTAKIIDAITM